MQTIGIEGSSKIAVFTNLAERRIHLTLKCMMCELEQQPDVCDVLVRIGNEFFGKSFLRYSSRHVVRRRMREMLSLASNFSARIGPSSLNLAWKGGPPVKMAASFSQRPFSPMDILIASQKIIASPDPWISCCYSLISRPSRQRDYCTPSTDFKPVSQCARIVDHFIFTQMRIW